LFQLLLERSKFGEWRIRVRLFVAAAGRAAERLGVVLLAFGALDPLTTIAAWTVAARAAFLTLDAFILTFHALLALVPVLAFFAIRTITALVAPVRA
jgi:hypothetical protein